MAIDNLEFRKRERVVSQKLIDQLFNGTGSHSMAAFPIRVVYATKDLETGNEAPTQLLISVPKRHFKHAVDRNRVKRQLREAYRHHKQIVWEAMQPRNQQLVMAFIWLSDHHLSTAEIDNRVKLLLQRIVRKL